MILYLCVLIVFSLHRDSLKLILAMNPFPRWFCHKWYQSWPSRFHRRVRVSWEGYGSIRVRDVGTYAWRVGPIGGIRYSTYATNWKYGTRMLVLDVRTWPRGDVPGLGLTNEDVGLLRGGLCHPGSRLNRIDRILIPPRYTFFFGSPPAKNFGVKRAWLGAISG
jgi:hypothetical protein